MMRTFHLPTHNQRQLPKMILRRLPMMRRLIQSTRLMRPMPVIRLPLPPKPN